MRSFLAFVALVLASVIATVALLAYAAHETVLEPRRAGQVLAQALDTAEVRDTVLARAVPGYAEMPAQYRDGLNQVVREGTVESALSDVEVDDRGRADLGPVRRELAGELEDNGYADLASQVRAAEVDPTLRIPPRAWKTYTDARETSWTLTTLGGLVAAALFVAAVVLARSRRAGVAAVGLAVLVSAAAAAALFRLLPSIAPLVTDDRRVSVLGELGAPALSTIMPVLLPVAVVGGVLVLVSFAFPGRRS